MSQGVRESLVRLRRWDAIVIALALGLLIAWVAIYAIALMLLPSQCASHRPIGSSTISWGRS